MIHRANAFRSELAQLLSNKNYNSVKEAYNFEILKNKIYLAPPDYHLLVNDQNEFCLDYSEKVLHCRPSIDVVFESFSSVYKERIVGVILSGANTDGALGLWNIDRRKGLAFVQDPETSEADSMPKAAIRYMGQDCKVLPPKELIKEIKTHLL